MNVRAPSPATREGDLIAKRAFAPIDALTRVDGLAAARTARLQALGRRLL